MVGDQTKWVSAFGDKDELIRFGGLRSRSFGGNLFVLVTSQQRRHTFRRCGVEFYLVIHLFAINPFTYFVLGMFVISSKIDISIVL